jgi:hypothetical protein
VPSRRDYLASGATVLAGLAGCAELEPTSSSTAPADEPLSWGDAATVAGVEVTPRTASVRHSAFYHLSPDSLGVLGFGDRQGVVAKVTAAGDEPMDPSAFSLAAGNDTAAGWQRYRSVGPHRFYALGTPLRESRRDTGWVGFDLPVETDAGEPALRVRSADGVAARWRLPDDAAAAIRAPEPSFVVRDFDAPERVAPGDPIEFSATVRNFGDGDGRFRASLNQLGPTYRFETVERGIPAGGEWEWSETLAAPHSDGDASDVNYQFHAPDQRFTGAVQVE